MDDWRDETETTGRGSLFWFVLAVIVLIARYLFKPFQ